MRIHSLSKVLAFPVGVVAAYMLYQEFYEFEITYGFWLMIPVGILVALLMFSGQIDFWWQEKHPMPLDDYERKLLNAHIPYYVNLDSEGKQKFEDRLSLYMGAREWKNVGTSELKSIPNDLQLLIGSQCIMITFHEDDYLLGDMDRVYTYRHPFPSPRYQFLHTLETNVEDGMIILSMEHSLPGVSNPDQYYNVVMHAYAEAYTKVHPGKQYPEISEIPWREISLITGFSKEQIMGVIGYPSIDPLPIVINMFFTYPEKTQEHLPELYEQLRQLFTVERLAA